jgi:hypothetical protein
MKTVGGSNFAGEVVGPDNNYFCQQSLAAQHAIQSTAQTITGQVTASIHAFCQHINREATEISRYPQKFKWMGLD